MKYFTSKEVDMYQGAVSELWNICEHEYEHGSTTVVACEYKYEHIIS